MSYSTPSACRPGDEAAADHEERPRDPERDDDCDEDSRCRVLRPAHSPCRSRPGHDEHRDLRALRARPRARSRRPATPLYGRRKPSRRTKVRRYGRLWPRCTCSRDGRVDAAARVRARRVAPTSRARARAARGSPGRSASRWLPTDAAAARPRRRRRRESCRRQRSRPVSPRRRRSARPPTVRISEGRSSASSHSRQNAQSSCSPFVGVRSPRPDAARPG